MQRWCSSGGGDGGTRTNDWGRRGYDGEPAGEKERAGTRHRAPSPLRPPTRKQQITERGQEGESKQQEYTAASKQLPTIRGPPPAHLDLRIVHILPRRLLARSRRGRRALRSCGLPLLCVLALRLLLCYPLLQAGRGTRRCKLGPNALKGP